MKAIAVLRVSTETQQIEDQKRELVAFARDNGYEEKDLVYVEAIGASAIKLDQKYMDMADKIKALILQGGIDCVFVWEISRLGRNEVILMGFKEFFIKHKVQFICKNPSLRLLDDDGRVNTGTELAFSLFSTMSKQEMEEKKARFKRAKDSLRKKGMYAGGNTIRFGYKVGDDQHFIVNEEEAGVVRLIYDLYSTGNYSAWTLSEELKERGLFLDTCKILRILKSVAYIGDEVSESGVHYPPIVSRELWEKCSKIRGENRLYMKRGERIVLCAKLVRCFNCGAICSSNSRHYACCRHANKRGCTNGTVLRQDVVDDLAWRIASMLHMDYLMDLNENKVQEYKEELSVTQEKLREAERKMQDYVAKKDRIVDTFLEGLIDRNKRDLALLKLKDDISAHREVISSLQAKERAILGMIEGGHKDTLQAFVSALDKMDTEGKFEIIHKHIEKITGEPESYGRRDPRTSKPNSIKITLTDIYGKEYLFRYFPKCYEGANLYIFNGREWVKDYVTKVGHLKPFSSHETQ